MSDSESGSGTHIPALPFPGEAAPEPRAYGHIAGIIAITRALETSCSPRALSEGRQCVWKWLGTGAPCDLIQPIVVE